MKQAYIFPGQGAQFPGMAKELFDRSEVVREMFGRANGILGFNITDIMFGDDAEALKQTKVTQPAVFLHSVAAAIDFMGGDLCQAQNMSVGTGQTADVVAGNGNSQTEDVVENDSKRVPDMVAGHSLGEFSALVVSGALSFEDGLRIVSARAKAMQKACEMHPGTMAAVLALDSASVERICREVSEESGEIVVATNYNCDGQIVISGSEAGVDTACAKMKESGARRALKLNVGGAFHSPLMSPARDELAEAIMRATFHTPRCPIYQNVTATASTDCTVIRENLLKQLTSPVRWTQSVKNMIADAGGPDHISFTEFGPGTVLQGLVRKICPEANINGCN